MNTDFNSVGQLGLSGDYSNPTARLPNEKESAGSYAGYHVSVHKIQEQDVQLSSQKPIGNEESSKLGDFKSIKNVMCSNSTGKNKAQSYFFLAVGGLQSAVTNFFQYFLRVKNELEIAQI